MLYSAQMVCHLCNQKIPYVVSQGPGKKPVCPLCNKEVEFIKCIPKEKRKDYELENPIRRTSPS